MIDGAWRGTINGGYQRTSLQGGSTDPPASVQQNPYAPSAPVSPASSAAGHGKVAEGPLWDSLAKILPWKADLNPQPFSSMDLTRGVPASQIKDDFSKGWQGFLNATLNPLQGEIGVEAGSIVFAAVFAIAIIAVLLMALSG